MKLHRFLTLEINGGKWSASVLLMLTVLLHKL